MIFSAPIGNLNDVSSNNRLDHPGTMRGVDLETPLPDVAGVI